MLGVEHVTACAGAGEQGQRIQTIVNDIAAVSGRCILAGRNICYSFTLNTDGNAPRDKDEQRCFQRCKEFVAAFTTAAEHCASKGTNHRRNLCVSGHTHENIDVDIDTSVCCETIAGRINVIEGKRDTCFAADTTQAVVTAASAVAGAIAAAATGAIVMTAMMAALAGILMVCDDQILDFDIAARTGTAKELQRRAGGNTAGTVAAGAQVFGCQTNVFDCFFDAAAIKDSVSKYVQVISATAKRVGAARASRGIYRILTKHSEGLLIMMESGMSTTTI